VTSTPLVALVVLDGFGIAPPGPGNAVELAATPSFDRIRAAFPATSLAASGRDVGLPAGQMGNSEVGHLNLGAGRVVAQDLVRLGDAIADGSFARNRAVLAACDAAVQGRGALHLLGLVSDGGVHSHVDHLRALVATAADRGVPRVVVHAFTDGRDVSPHQAAGLLARLEDEWADGPARIATAVGRYYAMDRDGRAERTERARAAIVDGAGRAAEIASQAVAESYEAGVTDEFVEPIVLGGLESRLQPGDAAFFFNFRPDRARQISHALVGVAGLYATMTRYDETLPGPVAFDSEIVQNTLADVLESAGVQQLHVAETEKYAHVTYFFNGGRERPHVGEERILVPSPRDVPTYDLAPEMSAAGVAERFCDAVAGGSFGFAVVNLANPDMVGHTGVIPAVVRAVEAADRALGRILDAVAARGGTCLVTADHGNAERMLEEDGSPHTAHTTSPVPLVLTRPGPALREGGRLGDVAPTLLRLLELHQPSDMTGKSLS
jgi:2,3-bisphosphoglycerate-independent phosphoglycerate mutase